MNRRCINASFFKLLCYLRRSKTSHTQSENISDYLGGFLIYNPEQLVFRVFNITVRRIGTEWLTRLSLGFEHSTDFLASILSVPFINNVKKRCKVTICLVCTINTVVNSNESYICIRKHNLGIISYFKVIPAESRHILDDNRSDSTGLYISNHAVKVWSIKSCTADPIIHIKFDVAKTVVLSIFFLELPSGSLCCCCLLQAHHHVRACSTEQ